MALIQLTSSVTLSTRPRSFSCAHHTFIICNPFAHTTICVLEFICHNRSYSVPFTCIHQHVPCTSSIRICQRISMQLTLVAQCNEHSIYVRFSSHCAG
ncbi:hypothetical protein RchiOBHm_Chr7g0216151 [Rosa chinensis]|uniref:Uncharacterized protein n=1 Tax=Rosa chinensis TaxID=74649 RepID=A0A2P6PBP1_ROSCH|nr:hypothetical protein RchiOBHm_Chr7g0216151 [Rosa chinensis]